MGKWFLYNGDTLYRCFSCQQGTCIVRFAKILAVNELVIKYFHYVKLNFIHPVGLQDVLELFWQEGEFDSSSLFCEWLTTNFFLQLKVYEDDFKKERSERENLNTQKERYKRELRESQATVAGLQRQLKQVNTVAKTNAILPKFFFSCFS